MNLWLKQKITNFRNRQKGYRVDNESHEVLHKRIYVNLSKFIAMVDETDCRGLKSEAFEELRALESELNKLKIAYGEYLRELIGTERDVGIRTYGSPDSSTYLYIGYSLGKNMFIRMKSGGFTETSTKSRAMSQDLIITHTILLPSLKGRNIDNHIKTIIKNLGYKSLKKKNDTEWTSVGYHCAIPNFYYSLLNVIETGLFGAIPEVGSNKRRKRVSDEPSTASNSNVLLPFMDTIKSPEGKTHLSNLATADVAAQLSKTINESKNEKATNLLLTALEKTLSKIN